MEYYLLKEVASYSNLRTSQIEKTSYISTENMLPNKGGITFATSIPNIYSASKYEIGDILLSNIRPYFCKIWLANKEGSCSNDVLVLKANEKVVSKFLYYVLSDKNFFNYDTVTSKGTKMPRGNKNAIMKYLVPKRNVQCQHRIASILSAYDSLIENNTKRIRLLEKMAENLYKEWFVRFRFPGYEKAEMENGLPKGWKVERYGEVAAIYAGGDKPKVYSKEISTECNIPIYSNGVENNGLYGFTNKATVKVSSITISARGTVGFVAIRRIPFVPIVRLLTVVPQKGLDVYYLYFASRNNDLEGNGTSQQQLTVPMLKKRKVVIPIKELLREFGNRCSLFYNQIDNLQHQNTLLARRRDLLLPRLMSGKLEVKP